MAYYIKKLPNLNYNSTQRAKSTHPVTSTLLNHQLNLADATRRLAEEIKRLLDDLKEVESQSYRGALLSLDR